MDKCVSDEEAGVLLPNIKWLFDLIVAKYQEEKYSPDIYRGLLDTFAKPSEVQESDIRRALLWKYGKREGEKLAPNQSSTIERIVKRWKYFLEATGSAIKLDSLTLPGGKYSDFVSRAFFLHLIAPNDLPIIDRYNHRAVRCLIGMVRTSFPLRSLPKSYDDILLVREFIETVRQKWGDTPPSRLTMDRYLMMFGKHVAPQY